jgi:hypothetical protein
MKGPPVCDGGRTYCLGAPKSWLQCRAPCCEDRWLVFEQLALFRVGRELADQLAILGFDVQLFQFHPQQIIFHTSGLPLGMAAEGPKVNTSLQFKGGRPPAHCPWPWCTCIRAFARFLADRSMSIEPK